MNRVYLAGKMGNRVVKDVLKERKAAVKLCRKHGFMPVDPGYSEAKDWKGYRISDSMSVSKMRKYVEKDLQLVRRSDALIVLTEEASDGTSYEKCYAKFMGLPVVIVAPNRCSGKLMGFSNILFHCEPTIEKAIKWLKKELK